MFSYFILNITILVLTICFSLIINKDFGKVIPYSCLSIALSLFIFTIIFYNFKFACAFLCAITITSFITILILNKKTIFKKIISLCKNGILAYLILVLFSTLLAFYHGKEPLNWDDYMPWAPMVKDIINTNYFYITENSNLFVHPEYPPLIVIFNAFSTVFENEFSSLNVFGSMFILQSAMLLPIVSEKKSSIAGLIYADIIIAFIYLFIIGLGNYYFFSIGQDCILSLVAGLAIYCVIWCNVDTKFWLSNLILMSTLLMIKQIGIVFMAITVLLILIKLILNKNYSFKTLLMFLCCTIVSFVPALTWNIIYSNSYTGMNFVSQFAISNFTDLIIAPVNVIQQNIDVVANYLWVLLNDPLICYLPISISYIGILIIISIFLFLILKKKERNKGFFIFSVVITLITYSIALGLCYICQFQGDEKENLASVHRYLCEPILVVFVCIFFYLCKKLNSSKLFDNTKAEWILMFLPICLCALFPQIFFNYLYHTYPRSDESIKMQNILSNNCEEGTEVLVIDYRLIPKDVCENSYYLDKTWISNLCKDNLSDNHVKYFWHRKDKSSKLRDFVLYDDKLPDNYIKELFYNENYIVTGEIPSFINESIYRVFGQKLENDSVYSYNNEIFTKK